MISLNRMSDALCNSFLNFTGLPQHEFFKHDQTVKFQIVWGANVFQNEQSGDIFQAIERIFEKTKHVSFGKIEVPQTSANGVLVRVTYPFLLGWHTTGGMHNLDFTIALALHDIARCLELIKPTNQTNFFLGKHPDPSPFWYKYLRKIHFSHVKWQMERERIRVDKETEKRRQASTRKGKSR